MSMRLHDLIEVAETRLSAPEQERLAALVESFVSNHADMAAFTKAELTHLREIDAEPFVAADPEALGRLFSRIG